MSDKNYNDWLQNRKSILAKMKKLESENTPENPWSEEKEAEYVGFEKSLKNADKTIARMKAAEDAQKASLKDADSDDSDDDDAEDKDGDEDEDEAPKKSFRSSVRSPAIISNMNAKAKKYSIGNYITARHMQMKTGSLSFAKNFALDTLKDAAVQKALTATADPNTIPQFFLAQWGDFLAAKSIMRQAGAQIFDTTQGNLVQPLVSAVPQATWLASENLQPTASNMGVANYHLGAHKVGILSDLSNDLIRRSAVSVASKLQDAMVTEMALAMDLAYLNGTGSGQPTGLFNVANANQQTYTIFQGASNAALTGTDLYESLRQAFLNMETVIGQTNVITGDAVIVMNTSDKNALRGVVTDLGVAPFAEEYERYGTILGHKVFISNQLGNNVAGTTSPTVSTSQITMFVPKYYSIADTLNVQFETSNVATYVNSAGVTTNAFAQDLTVYKILAETDGNSAYPQSISVLTATGLGTSTNGGTPFSFPQANASTGTVAS